MNETVDLSGFLKASTVLHLATNKDRIDFHYEHLKSGLRLFSLDEKYVLQERLKNDFSVDDFLVIGEALKSFFVLEQKQLGLPLPYDMRILLYYFCEVAELCNDTRIIPVLKCIVKKVKR